MYAIVNIAGQQFKVEEDQKIFVHRLEGKEDTKVSFDDVLLIGNNGKIFVGDPVIQGAKVSAKILEHLKADKIIVFKKKRRKGYSVKNAHRQFLTKIQIEKIFAKGGSASGGEEKTATKKESAKAVAKTETPAKVPAKKPTKTKTTTKKATAKKTEAKVTTSKKPTAKKTTPKKEGGKKA